jgi:transposase InsO family protein
MQIHPSAFDREVWWLRLGIAIERIKPGHPQPNGRHERMHLTLKKEATRPPGFNSLQQQDRFDAFVHEFSACISR